MNEEEIFYDAEEEYCDPGTGASYSLHRAAFENDVVKLTALLQETPQEQRSLLDSHGNNPLHIAALRGHTEAIQALLDAGLSPSARSSRGWAPLDEACAGRSMAAARLLQRALLGEVKAEMKAKRGQLLDTMRSMPDYSLQLKWQIGSSLPGLGMLLRRYAPHDTYTIWKVGDRLRVDGSLMGIDTKNIMPEWKRGHFSLVVDGSPAGVAAAAEAAAAAVAAASAAADAKERARQQRAEKWQQKHAGCSTADPQSCSEGGSSSGEQRIGDGVDHLARSNGHHAGSEAGERHNSSSRSSSSRESADEEEFHEAEEQQHMQHKQQEELPSAATSSGAGSSNGNSSQAAAAAGTSAAAAAAAASTSAAVAAAASTSSAAAAAAAASTSAAAAAAAAASTSAAAAAAAASTSAAATPPASSTSTSAVPSGGPRLLFLNHVKSSWVDLSADKKALKLEGRAEQDELEAELAAAMERDVDKLRLKPRNFKFNPVRGWLGGTMTEKVEGWKCTVYEATGKLLAVSTSKARLRLPKDATFDDYLAAEYEADEVTETLIDPLNPSSMGPGSSSGNSSKHKSRDKGSHHGYDGKGSLTYGGSSSAADDTMGLGSEADFDAMLWDEQASSSKKDKKAASKKASSSGNSEAAGAGAAAAGGGRLLRARCWMAQDFPMQLGQLLPLLDVIGTANKHMAKVGKFLAEYSQMDMFPVKLQVPLLLTVYVLVSFKAFHPLLPGSATPPPSPDFFEVPGSYKRRLLSEVMDKAAANMMGMGPGRGSSRGGSSGGGSCFYGGDEGEEGMMFGDDDDFLEGRDDELQREFERLQDEREGGGGSSGGANSSSKGGWRRKPKGRAGVIGSGLDSDMQDSSKW